MISKEELQGFRDEFEKQLNILLNNLPHSPEAFLIYRKKCHEASDTYATALMLYAQQVDVEVAEAYYQQSRRQGATFNGFIAILTDYHKRYGRGDF